MSGKDVALGITMAASAGVALYALYKAGILKYPIISTTAPTPYPGVEQPEDGGAGTSISTLKKAAVDYHAAKWDGDNTVWLNKQNSYVELKGPITISVEFYDNIKPTWPWESWARKKASSTHEAQLKVVYTAAGVPVGSSVRIPQNTVYKYVNYEDSELVGKGYFYDIKISKVG